MLIRHFSVKTRTLCLRGKHCRQSKEISTLLQGKIFVMMTKLKENSSFKRCNFRFYSHSYLAMRYDLNTTEYGEAECWCLGAPPHRPLIPFSPLYQLCFTCSGPAEIMTAKTLRIDLFRSMFHFGNFYYVNQWIGWLLKSKQGKVTFPTDLLWKVSFTTSILNLFSM